MTCRLRRTGALSSIDVQRAVRIYAEQALLRGNFEETTPRVWRLQANLQKKTSYVAELQVDAYRSPTSTERVQEELYEFMRSRLSSLLVMHRQMVQHFSGLAASKLQNPLFCLFQASRIQAAFRMLSSIRRQV
jgi:hypothetical protein